MGRLLFVTSCNHTSHWHQHQHMEWTQFAANCGRTPGNAIKLFRDELLKALDARYSLDYFTDVKLSQASRQK